MLNSFVKILIDVFVQIHMLKSNAMNRKSTKRRFFKLPMYMSMPFFICVYIHVNARLAVGNVCTSFGH